MKYQHNENDNSIFEFITRALNDHLTKWYGNQGSLSIMTPVILTYNNCFIMRFPLLGPSGITKNIMVKIRRHPKMQSLNQAILNKELHVKILAEYNDLVSLYNFFGNRDDSLAAIRPLIYLEQYFAIVMEEFPSQTLREILCEWKTVFGFKNNINDLLNAAQLTGQLLNSFHSQMHKYCEIEKPYQPIMDEVQTLTDRLKITSQQQNLANSVHSKFLQKINSIQPKKVIYSNIHGDMTSDNVLYSKENKICMIDVKTKLAPIYSDIGLIMIHPDVYMVQIFSFGLFFRKQNIQAYRAAILKGYFGNQNFDSDLINLYCAIKMLDKWILYENIMFNSKGRKRLLSLFAAPLLRIYFIDGMTRYLDAIN